VVWQPDINAGGQTDRSMSDGLLLSKTRGISQIVIMSQADVTENFIWSEVRGTIWNFCQKVSRVENGGGDMVSSRMLF
jgi:hypothetical protein